MKINGNTIQESNNTVKFTKLSSTLKKRKFTYFSGGVPWGGEGGWGVKRYFLRFEKRR
jgi:hypothetical protein